MYIACFADSVIFGMARGLEYNFNGIDFVGCKVKYQMMSSQNKDCLQINDTLLCMYIMPVSLKVVSISVTITE